MPATSHPRASRGAGRATASALSAAAMTSRGLPCRLVLPDGQVTTQERAPEAHVRAYLRAVVAPQHEIARYMEFPRGRRVNGELEVARWPRENFHDPGDRRAIYGHVMARLDRGEEMFCGPVPRTAPKPRKDAVQAGRVRDPHGVVGLRESADVRGSFGDRRREHVRNDHHKRDRSGGSDGEPMQARID